MIKLNDQYRFDILTGLDINIFSNTAYFYDYAWKFQLALMMEIPLQMRYLTFLILLQHYCNYT